MEGKTEYMNSCIAVTLQLLSENVVFEHSSNP